MADPMDVLAPNYMGDTMSNQGVESLADNIGMGSLANTGRGVVEANPQAMKDKNAPASPAAMKDKQRTASARQFGTTKDTVGF